MGVPLLFRYFARLCPEAINDRPPPRGLRPTNLYIDFNNVVHNCARMPGVSSEEDVIEASIAHVRGLQAEIAPPGTSTGTVYIAVDGVPPRAKMLQQRCRRYAGAASDADADDGDPPPPAWWNSCVVTPGTAFMRQLSTKLHAEFGSAKDTIYIVSDASEPGEGEQKLFRHLVGSSEATSAVICGMDADLIVMGLVATLRGHSVHISRDGDDGKRTYVDVNALAGHLHCRVMRRDTPSSSIRQFVAMLALLGNDFVPALPGLTLRHNGNAIDALVRALKPAQQCAALVCEHSSSVDLAVLQGMLGELSHTESSAIRIAEERGGLWNSIQPAAPGWRPRYNQRVFGQSHPDGMHEICKAYVAGIVWNATYMLEHRALSEGFLYPWNYAPTAHDLALFLATSDLMHEIPKYLDQAEISDRKARCLCSASPEAWQLCHVLPPSQAHLIDSAEHAIRRAMTDPRFGATHFYPTTFSRSTYLVPSSAPAHLRVPILPIFDDQVLANAIIRAASFAS